MKKLLVGIMVCSMSTLAMGASFQFVGTDPVEILPGQTVVIPVTTTGSGLSAGMVLNLATSGPFEIRDLVIDGVGSGTLWESNSTGAEIYTHATLPDVVTDWSLAVGMVTTSSGTIAYAPGAVLAKISISVPANAAIGSLGYMTTDGDNGRLDPSDLLNTSGASLGLGQSTIGLKVIPEPATALLLIGALPFIRRRRA